jgi:hypothetical protein
MWECGLESTGLGQCIAWAVEDMVDNEPSGSMEDREFLVLSPHPYNPFP